MLLTASSVRPCWPSMVATKLVSSLKPELREHPPELLLSLRGFCPVLLASGKTKMLVSLS
jgi:hypothetical protein